MGFKKFIQISTIPAYKRLEAQRRVSRDGVYAVAISDDVFRVKSSGGFHNILSSSARPGIDFYEVQTYESDGELFATCTCPHGTKGEDDDQTLCKHIEAALKVRVAKRAPVVPIPTFETGKIIIDVGRNELVVRSNATASDGTVLVAPTMRRKRITAGTGYSVVNKLLEFIDREF